MVERVSDKDEVVGPIPTSPTTRIKVRSYFLAITWSEHFTPLPFYFGSAKADPFFDPSPEAA